MKTIRVGLSDSPIRCAILVCSTFFLMWGCEPADDGQGAPEQSISDTDTDTSPERCSLDTDTSKTVGYTTEALLAIIRTGAESYEQRCGVAIGELADWGADDLPCKDGCWEAGWCAMLDSPCDVDPAWSADRCYEALTVSCGN